MGLGNILPGKTGKKLGATTDPASATTAGSAEAVDELVLEPQREEAEKQQQELERQTKEAQERQKQDALKVEAAKRKKIEDELKRRGRRASILTSAQGVKDELGIVSRPEATTNLGGTFE